MKLRILGFIAFLSLSATAQAGFHVEPYLGAATSSTDIAIKTIGGTDKSDDTETGSVLGARLGYSFLLVSAGIDYGILSGDENKVTNTSLFVGVDLPILFRFWYEHGLSSDVDIDASSLDFDFVSGQSFGVGFTGLPFVSLNLELEQLKYETEGGSGVGSYEGDFDVSNIIFSVSLPLDL